MRLAGRVLHFLRSFLVLGPVKKLFWGVEGDFFFYFNSLTEDVFPEGVIIPLIVKFYFIFPKQSAGLRLGLHSNSLP